MGNATAMMVMDGAMAMPMAMVMAMDSTMATAIEGGTATRWQRQQWVSQWQHDSYNGDGRGDGDGDGWGNSNGNGRGNGNGDGRRNSNAMGTMVMDSPRAMTLDVVMAMQWQRNVQQQRDSNRRPVFITDIRIKEVEIAREYDKGALPLVAMPLLLHGHLLIQGQGFQ